MLLCSRGRRCLYCTPHHDRPGDPVAEALSFWAHANRDETHEVEYQPVNRAQHVADDGRTPADRSAVILPDHPNVGGELPQGRAPGCFENYVVGHTKAGADRDRPVVQINSASWSRGPLDRGEGVQQPVTHQEIDERLDAP